MIVVGLTGGIGAGKSTVSALLAERGAVIVDADLIARELQAPGTPVVQAMVERFGPAIVDGGGTLIRSAVAEIVFSDPEALKALNGIVHPAMQSEIDAQIAAQRDTDRVVVLDFPLLGENPRRGLAATIVVDIPYDLAIERVVEFRDMDEADAHKRVNSQMKREDRLAIATHVIDNSGDHDALVVRVAEVWSELQALPPTDPTDVRLPSGGDRVAWVFGYGSLVEPSSLARTIGRVARLGDDMFPATLTGYGRRWNYGVGHVSGTWVRVDGSSVENGTIVALGLVESHDESVNGVLVSVTADELAEIARRERDYDRVDVADRVTTDPDGAMPEGSTVVTFVPRRSAVERYVDARDAGSAGIRDTYLDVVDAAFAALSDEQADIYRATTPSPDVPVVSVTSTRAR